MTRICKCCCLMLVMGVAAPAWSTTIYVNNQLGSDRATGLSAQPDATGGPVRSLAVALLLVDSGDQIVLANTGEPYREQISLSLPRHSGLAGKPFVIQGNGAVLDGTVVAAPGAWRHVEGNVFAMRPRRLAYQQLFTTEGPLKRVQLLSEYEVGKLQPLEWALLEGEIYFCTEGNQIPEEYNLRHAGLQTGITLYDVRHVRIENLVVQGFQQDGVNAHELVRDCELIDIDSRSNGRAGLSVGGASRVAAFRCNFYGNGRVQVRTEGLGELTLTNCDVGNVTAPAYRALGRLLEVDGEIITSSTNP